MISNEMNSKKSMPRHITDNILKTRNNEKLKKQRDRETEKNTKREENKETHTER